MATGFPSSESAEGGASRKTSAAAGRSWLSYLQGLLPRRRRQRRAVRSDAQLGVEALEPRSLFTGTPTISLSSGPTSLTEGQSATVTVSRSGGAVDNDYVSVYFGGTTSNGAYYGSDYYAPSWITFTPGQTAVSINIEALRDQYVEPTESFTFSIAPGSGYTGSGSFTTSIQDDPQVIGISSAPSTMTEGDSVEVELTRSGGNLAEQTVYFDFSQPSSS
ncbi:MAG TPA: Calx-beta domain-containing protein [Pirellulales bacterium]